MTIIGSIVLFTWPLVVLAMFATLNPRRALALAYVMGNCFLPNAIYGLPFIPDYGKASATTYGCILGLCWMHSKVLVSWRPKLIDLPMIVFCIVPAISSLTNGLGPQDAVASSLSQIVSWGLPYVFGRMFFTRLEHLRDLVEPIILGAVLYVPLCLYEIRMSPRLHTQVYGFNQHSFLQSLRAGGWRPIVFMQHGLMVALWMASALVLAICARFVGGVKRWKGFSFAAVVVVLGVTTVMLRSAGALVLVVLAVGIIWASLKLNRNWIVPAFAVVIGILLTLRASGSWDGHNIVSLVENFSTERASSLQFRLQNEDKLSAKAREQLVFGWGGWGRGRIYDGGGTDVSVSDSLWIITLGSNGLLGMVSLYASMLIGPSLLMYRLSPSQWRMHPSRAVAAGVGVVCLMNVIDSIPNAMVIPVIVLTYGVATSMAIYLPQALPVPKPDRRPAQGRPALGQQGPSGPF